MLAAFVFLRQKIVAFLLLTSASIPKITNYHNKMSMCLLSMIYKNLILLIENSYYFNLKFNYILDAVDLYIQGFEVFFLYSQAERKCIKKNHPILIISFFILTKIRVKIIRVKILVFVHIIFHRCSSKSIH